MQGCLFLTATLLLLGVPLAGCDRSCRSDDTCRRAGGGGEPAGAAACPDDPAEGDVRPSCGVWVSASLGDDDNDGSQGFPVKTLSRGIDLAKMADGGARRVYACEGTYPELVVLPNGVSLFGGFECPRADGWRYIGFDKRAVILAPPLPAALVLTEGEEVSFVGDLRIVATDAPEPGGSSIAVLALAGSQAYFPRAELVAGNGADGADGADGSPDGQPAPDGSAGAHGADACTADVGLGGAGVVAQCDDAAQPVSGKGGDGNKVTAGGGGEGLMPPDPNPEGYGKGGKGEDTAKGTLCTPGYGGAHGADGFHGFGAVGVGRLTKDGYLGVWGMDGTPGLPGQGGGGGGGTLGALCPGPLYGGSGGGSGGSGGCGGKGGKGGQPGGSSIGIAALSKFISAGTLLVTTGNGGHGGRGGKLQSGGLGGLAGYGGIGVGGMGGAKDGCAGGVGGNGGKGGNGGGGHGGHSFATTTTGFDLSVVDLEFALGAHGLGGPGGDPGALPGAGEKGDAHPAGRLDP